MDLSTILVGAWVAAMFAVGIWWLGVAIIKCGMYLYLHLHGPVVFVLVCLAGPFLWAFMCAVLVLKLFQTLLHYYK